jgi:hypothetical protein
MFTIQASTALDDNNNFNLTQANDIDNSNVQIDEAQEVNPSQGNAPNAISVSSQNEVLGASNNDSVLGVSNDNDVLGRDIPVTTYTMAALKLQLESANSGDRIFLNGGTFTGPFDSITIKKNIEIYGGSSPDDHTRATLDLSQFNVLNKPRIVFSAAVTIMDVDFVNHNYSPTTGDKRGSGNIIRVTNSISMYNCSFINNTVFQKSYLIEFTDNAQGLSPLIIVNLLTIQRPF